MIVPDDRVGIVTGAGSGIGRACALDLAGRGFRVVVSDVNEDAGAEVVGAIEQEGGTAAFVSADVSDPDRCESLVSQTRERFGRLDAAINNAGIGGEQAMTGDYPIEAWHTLMGVNLHGVFYCMRSEIRAMLDNGGGSIVNMASILGAVGFPQAPAYVAAKHGVVGLTRAAAQEYATQGIRINAVGPGFIQTPLLDRAEMDQTMRDMLVALHPIGRLGTSEEVATLAGWLCEAAPDFLTGAYIPIDGGYLAR